MSDESDWERWPTQNQEDKRGRVSEKAVKEPGYAARVEGSKLKGPSEEQEDVRRMRAGPCVRA